MLAIPNTTTAATYGNATTFPPEVGAQTPYVQGFLVIANASAFVSVLKGRDQGSAVWTPDVLQAPSLLPIAVDRLSPNGDKIFGVRFKDGVAGTHAQIFGALFQAGEVAFTPGTEFTSTVSSSGGVTPPSGGNLITGQVSSAGAVLAGTGFTVARTAAGRYTVTFTTPFAAPPTVVATCDDSAHVIAIPQGATLAGSFSVQTNTNDAGGGAASDNGFQFHAAATV